MFKMQISKQKKAWRLTRQPKPKPKHPKADIFVCPLRTFLMSSDGQIPDQPTPIDHWVDGRCSHCGAQRR